MNHEEAIKKAQELVFVYFTMPDIINNCKLLGIPTIRKNGRLRDRAELEQELINAIAKDFEK